MAKKKRLTGMDTPRATNLNKVTNQTWFNKKLIQEILDSGLGLGVSSFNGRVGTVIPLEGDYAPYYTRKVLTTRGDLMTYNTDVVRLPIGPSGHVLTSDGTDITWAPPVGGGGGSTFVSLTDTPNTMTIADAGLSPTVDAFGVALEYIAKANMAGNAGINFNVANATLPDHAVNLSQLQELSGGLTYKGAWTPSPVTGDAGWPFPDEGTLDPNDNGHFWIVDTDGFDKDDRPFSMGDWIVFNGQGDGSLGTSWGQFSFGAGSSTFVALTDTPNSYFGNAGKTMVVNGTESGLEYFATPLTGFVPYTGAVQALDMGSNLVKTSAAPGVNIDLTNKLYVDTAVGTRVPYTGASSLLDMGGLAVKTTHVPAVGVDLTNKLYVDTKFVPYTGANMVIDLNVQNIKSTFVPLVDADLINKKYFDDTIDNVADAFVPYTGATANLDLGAFNVTATQFIGDGSQLTNLTFLQLTDTPNAYTSPDIGKVLAVNGTFDGLELITPVTAFTQLSDTAAALGSAFQVATMNATGTQIIWATPWIPPTTTKGDIIVFSGTVDERLEVGPDDTFLIADSTEPLGVRWGILPDVGVSTFIELTDTPNTMVAGDAGKGLVVNALGNALEYKNLAALEGLASQSFLVKAATSANEAVNLSQLNFTSLTDTAATLGAPGTVATINAGGDQVIWATIPAGVTDHTLLSNIGVKTHATLDTEVNINNAKVGITPQQASDITTNNAKVGITPQQSADIITNNAKVGITAQQSADIITNNAKVSNVDHPLVETAVPIGAVFTDDYVDTIAFAANILTLGRTGALPDLTQSLNTLWGSPLVDGQVLSSNVSGDRTWITIPTPDLSPYQLLSEKGSISGYAELDATGRVPVSQLPEALDDVLEFPTLGDFPATGSGGTIYVALDTNKTYRWSGSTYVELSSGLVLGETSTTAYRGDRGKIAYDHSQSPHAPADANNYVLDKAKVEAVLTGLINSHTHAYTNLSLGETSSTAYRGDRGKIAYDFSQRSLADYALLSGTPQIFTGDNTFNNQVNIPLLPTADEHAASKKYVDDNAIDFLNLNENGGLWERIGFVDNGTTSKSAGVWYDIASMDNISTNAIAMLQLTTGGTTADGRVRGQWLIRVQRSATTGAGLSATIKTHTLYNHSDITWMQKLRVVQDSVDDQKFIIQAQYAGGSLGLAFYDITLYGRVRYNTTGTGYDSILSTEDGSTTVKSVELENIMESYYYPKVGYLASTVAGGGISNPIAYGTGLTTASFGVASANKTEVVLNAGYVELNAYNASADLGYFRIEHDFAALHARFSSADGSVGSLSWYDTTNTFIMDSKLIVQVDPTVDTGVGNRLYNDGRYALASASGTVTAVNNGNGMNFTNITGAGTVTLGTPSSLSGTSTNAVTTSSHTHAITTGAVANNATIPSGADVITYVTGLGYTSNPGTVTQVSNGSGMNFTNITGSGTVTLGTPSSLSGSSTNAVTASSHTHVITTGAVANTSVICSGADIITYVTGLGFAGGTVTSVVAGAGMTQTGTSTINPTLNVVGGNGIVSNANNIALGALTANWAGGSVYTITANDFILGSDKALKTRVETLKGGLLDVRYVEFEYKTNLGRRRAGVIANEIVDKYPELVHKDDDGLLSVSYTDLLIKEVSGLKNEVISLKDENTALKKRLDTLEKLVNSML